MANDREIYIPTIGEHLKDCGVSRRSFLQLCAALMATAPVGMALTDKANVLQVAKKVASARRPSVIWLHFQDCTGCSETLLRTSAPDVASLILDVISLDYHETLMAASGAQAEAALKQKRRSSRRCNRTPGSTSWWSKARFRRGMTAFTWNWQAGRRCKWRRKWRRRRRQ